MIPPDSPLARYAERARARPLQRPTRHNVRAPSLAERLRTAPGIVAELKPASPTEGAIRDLADARDLARALANAGAAGISALTEPTDFRGGPELLAAAVESGAPALMKDFVVTNAQLDLARDAGASAVLLILPLLDAKHSEWATPEEALDAAWDRELEVLLEVYDEAGLMNAVALGADLVGINNRDLRDPALPVDAGASLALLSKYRDWDVPLMALSGVREPHEAHALVEAGASGILIGTAIMRAPNPVTKLKKLVEAIK